MRKTALLISLVFVTGLVAGQADPAEVQGLNNVDVEIGPVLPEEASDVAEEAVQTHPEIEEAGVSVSGVIELSDTGVQHEIETVTEDNNVEVQIQLEASEEDTAAGMAIVEEEIDEVIETGTTPQNVSLEITGQENNTFQIREEVDFTDEDQDQIEAEDQRPDPATMDREELETEVQELRTAIDELRDQVETLQAELDDEDTTEETEGLQETGEQEETDEEDEGTEEAQDETGDEAEADGFVNQIFGLF